MLSYGKCLSAAALLIAATFIAPVAPVAAQQPPLFQNPAAPMDKRVDDLLSRLTLDEKISQLMNDSPA
ncbi:MAG TPA: hypothetical protein VKJ01_08080, partial [Candidatus Solibacter sp.]|nr:hypothetical protein [Candidatus Solibacter sp.]